MSLLHNISRGFEITSFCGLMWLLITELGRTYIIYYNNGCQLAMAYKYNLLYHYDNTQDGLKNTNKPYCRK